MKRVIYRVDDRLIHGQVVEGWINYYNIRNIILVNDRIASDKMQRFIYESVVPAGKKLLITTISEFLKKKPYKKIKKDRVLIILGSIADMYALKELPDESSYINIGCVATESRDIEITDTVYVDGNQLAMLKEISACHDIFVHKVPWEMPVNIKGFDISSHGGNK